MNKLMKIRKCDHKCYPLINYDEIINFKVSSIEQSLIDEYCIEIRSKFTISGPKTLICHDYKGGYLNDACIKGSMSIDEYRFYHWHLIDIFIYFSHQLITIPPIPWIYTAHLNGVTIMGTIITENKSGKEFINFVLSNNDRIHQLARSLASIMSVYRFDGWLLNIENDIEANLVPELANFTRILTNECKKLNKNSYVIWYDAVTCHGLLRWQNELNAHNELFFNCCDAIFLNYGWRTKHLTNSLTLASKKGRKDDVFVGVDVFGRGCYGNGGFNTRLAIDFIRKFNLSIAIFAPGWIHEANDSKQFEQNNHKFWSELNLPIRHLPNKLPIETSICAGMGHNYFEYGQSIDVGEWTSNLMAEFQLNCEHTKIDYTDAYCGGVCLMISDLNYN